MGSQKEIAKVIDEREGNYVLQVKDNQPTLHQEIVEYFESQIGGSLQPNEETYLETFDTDHGRMEKRQYWHSHDIEWFADRSEWSGLGGFGMMKTTRTDLSTGTTHQH